jgi:peptidyl-tRNA hydrolase, PTH1 family
MMRIIVGLGNKGAAYRATRHNAGRMAVALFATTHNFPTFRKKNNTLVSQGEIEGMPVLLVLPETYMNESGPALIPLTQGKYELLVVRDELDVPLGGIKMTGPGRGAGGHHGVESVMTALKTKEFMQLKLGISPAHKLPAGDAVTDHVLTSFTQDEKEGLTTMLTRAAEAMRVWVTTGESHALLTTNTKVDR